MFDVLFHHIQRPKRMERMPTYRLRGAARPHRTTTRRGPAVGDVRAFRQWATAAAAALPPVFPARGAARASTSEDQSHPGGWISCWPGLCFDGRAEQAQCTRPDGGAAKASISDDQSHPGGWISCWPGRDAERRRGAGRWRRIRARGRLCAIG